MTLALSWSGGKDSALALGALTLLLLAVVAWRWPAVLAWPLGVICAWLALNLAIRAWRERRRKPGSTD